MKVNNFFFSTDSSDLCAKLGNRVVDQYIVKKLFVKLLFAVYNNHIDLGKGFSCAMLSNVEYTVMTVVCVVIKVKLESFWCEHKSLYVYPIYKNVSVNSSDIAIGGFDQSLKKNKKNKTKQNKTPQQQRNLGLVKIFPLKGVPILRP